MIFIHAFIIVLFAALTGDPTWTLWFTWLWAAAFTIIPSLVKKANMKAELHVMGLYLDDLQAADSTLDLLTIRRSEHLMKWRGWL